MTEKLIIIGGISSPDNYQALAMLGKILSYDKDKQNQVQEYLIKALEISPDYPDAGFDLARGYAQKGEAQKTLTELDPLFTQEPEFAVYHFEAGRMLEAWKDKAIALRHYQRAHILNPRFEAARQAVERLDKDARKAHPAVKGKSKQ